MIRLVKITEIESVMEIIEDAKALLKLDSLQWQQGYPNRNTMLNDIKNHSLFGYFDNERLIGIIALVYGFNPDYETIDGEWTIKSGDNDLTIHRIAVKKEFHKKKIGDSLIKFAIKEGIKNNVKSIKIDTHKKNIPMQKIALNNGFIYKGIIELVRDEVDNKRLAYELLINNESSITCKYYKKCGSCKYIDISYKAELKKKEEYLNKLLSKFNKVNPIIKMDNPYHYRNKCHMAFDIDKDNKIISGLYEASTHNIVKVNSCLIDDSISDEIILKIKELVKKYNIHVYSERKDNGILRHVLIKRSFTTSEIMVVIVATTLTIKGIDELIKELIESNKNIKTVILNLNDKFGSMVLGDKERVVYGDGYITDNLLGMNFRISSKSFYQVNPIMAKALYSKVIELIGINKRDILLDAYSGTGTIGLLLSKNSKKVISVELNKDAVNDAKRNALINHVDNIDIVCNDATKYINKLAYDKEKIDCVVMDPPRTGSTFEFLKSLIKLSPRKIIYVSCGPETLKRDLEYLTRYKYKVSTIQPVDMFPHTEHIETVVLLSKNEK